MMQLGVPMMIFAIVLGIAMIVAYPSAFGVYYSRCFKIKFTYGMLLSLAPLLLALIVAFIPVLAPIMYVAAPLLALVLIAAVYRQFSGKCSLSTLKNA